MSRCQKFYYDKKEILISTQFKNLEIVLVSEF